MTLYRRRPASRAPARCAGHGPSRPTRCRLPRRHVCWRCCVRIGPTRIPTAATARATGLHRQRTMAPCTHANSGATTSTCRVPTRNPAAIAAVFSPRETAHPPPTPPAPEPAAPEGVNPPPCAYLMIHTYPIDHECIRRRFTVDTGEGRRWRANDATAFGGSPIVLRFRGPLALAQSTGGPARGSCTASSGRGGLACDNQPRTVRKDQGSPTSVREASRSGATPRPARWMPAY